MINWRIYYEDGTTFTNLDGGPEDAPAFGMLMVVQHDDDVGRLVMHAWDWFYWRADHQQWWGADIYGLLDQLLHNKPISALKQGRNTHTATYKAILQKAIEDPDFMPKSGNIQGERPHINT